MKQYDATESEYWFEPQKGQGLSLIQIAEFTLWTAEEFEFISNMEVGDVHNFDGVTVERTQ